jgi:hypothetical protein
VVDHSQEGTQAGAYSVLDGPAQSSWTFSLPKFSEPIQHYGLTKITWHAGLPGDRRHDTSLIGNLTLVGKEHEGKAGEPWTENQVYWSAKIDVALRELCPAFGANPPTLRKNMWEHRWLSATSCPSGRNPWHAKFALITEWELEPTEEDDMSKHIHSPKKVGMELLGFKRELPSDEQHKAIHAMGYKDTPITDAQWDVLPYFPFGGGGGGGATPEEMVEAVKQAQREGTA